MKFIIHTTYLPPQIDTSIWVGDLTPEVDDFALYRYFTQRYGTVRCAKVPHDSITADSQLTSPVLSGGAGRVWVQQGIRLREVRERAGAAARPGLHDRGDGARQQAHQGWSP